MSVQITPNSLFSSRPSSQFKVNQKRRRFVYLNEVDVIKIANCLNKVFNIQSDKSMEVARKCFESQARLQVNQAIKLPSSSQVPCEIVITKTRIHCLIEQIGEGTYSQVFESTVIPTIRHQASDMAFSPGKPQTLAIKRSKRAHAAVTFSPEKRMLESLGCNDLEEVDGFIDVFKDKEGFSYSLNKRGYSLRKFNFHEIENPIASIVKVFASCARALARMHAKNGIHRDIKGGNILVRLPACVEQDPSTPESPGKSTTRKVAEIQGGIITDFGFLYQQQTTRHFTTGTPPYLDPAMFGSLEECLYNQKIRRGIQTKAGDIFALGITLVKDVFKKFILGLCTQADATTQTQVQELIESLAPKQHPGPFTNEELREIGKKSNYRIMHSIDDQQQEFLIQYPDLKFTYDTLLEAANKLSDLLIKKEQVAFIQLIELACQMQDRDLTKRPTAKVVYAQMKEIENSLCRAKRNLATEFEDEGISRKKARGEGEDISPKKARNEEADKPDTSFSSSSFVPTQLYTSPEK